MEKRGWWLWARHFVRGWGRCWSVFRIMKTPRGGANPWRLFWRLGLRRCWRAVPGGPCLAGRDSLAGIFRRDRKLDRDAAYSDAFNQDDSWTDAATILRSLIDEIRIIPRSVDNDP